MRPANGANCQTPSLRIVTDLTEAGCVVKKKAAVEKRTESRTNCPAGSHRPRHKGHFPTEDAARKLIYLAIHNAVPQLTRTRGWTKALLAFKSSSETGYPTNPPTQLVGHPPSVSARDGKLTAFAAITCVGRRCPLSSYPRSMAGLTRRFHVPSALRYSSLRIERAAARQLIADGALLIDVRRGEDGLDSPDGALRITPDAIPERLGAFSREVPIVLGCT